MYTLMCKGTLYMTTSTDAKVWYYGYIIHKHKASKDYGYCMKEKASIKL